MKKLWQQIEGAVSTLLSAVQEIGRTVTVCHELEERVAALEDQVERLADKLEELMERKEKK